MCEVKDIEKFVIALLIEPISCTCYVDDRIYIFMYVCINPVDHTPWVVFRLQRICFPFKFRALHVFINLFSYQNKCVLENMMYINTISS